MPTEPVVHPDDGLAHRFPVHRLFDIEKVGALMAELAKGRSLARDRRRCEQRHKFLEQRLADLLGAGLSQSGDDEG